jgi:hypothetical protein
MAGINYNSFNSKGFCWRLKRTKNNQGDNHEDSHQEICPDFFA